jgi:hypothetical protein
MGPRVRRAELTDLFGTWDRGLAVGRLDGNRRVDRVIKEGFPAQFEFPRANVEIHLR